MNYQKITKHDIANGEGVRVTLWVSGCSHHCKGCQNPQTWNENSGQPFTTETMDELYQALSHDYISGLTFSGGDPLFEKNRSVIKRIARVIKNLFPKISIWLYTGFLWEQIKDLPLMEYIDVLVDGEFEEDKKNICLMWCGSENQRVIDVQRSRREGECILWVTSEEKRP